MIKYYTEKSWALHCFKNLLKSDSQSTKFKQQVIREDFLYNIAPSYLTSMLTNDIILDFLKRQKYNSLAIELLKEHNLLTEELEGFIKINGL